MLAACSGSDEARLRTELKTWAGTPYAERGTTRKGISNAAFVREVFHNAIGVDVPPTRDEQYRTGKLVERGALRPGDIVFLEGQGFGPFRSHSVAIFVGHDEMAIATKEAGVTVVRLTEPRWSAMYETARHIPRDSAEAAAPALDAAKYGANRGALLRDIAKAWTGTLYRDNGTTFDGIGNFEYVRAIYEAINDQELEGTPATWVKMGSAVKREDLQPGDIILYQAVGLSAIFGRLHAGMYVGNGEFTHCVKGAAVTISKLDDPRWKTAFRSARRIDQTELAALHETRPERVVADARSAATASATIGKATPAPTIPAIKATPLVPMPPAALGAPESETERRLRSVTESWRGTPYKLGGNGKSGIDCSAFSRVVYKDGLAIDLPRTAAEQELLGTPIARQNLRAGDLVFFRTQGMGPFFKSRHVGVYLGGGEFGQSSGSKGVTVSRLDSYYWNKKYVAARRLTAS